MVPILLHDDKSPISIPGGIESFGDFRAWTKSRTFPTTGRIDYVASQIEVDMSPEEFFSHGGPKEALARTLGPIVHAEALGYLRIDRIRVVADAVQLSAEPDLLFVSHESLDAGRVQLSSPRKRGKTSYLEVTGGPDLVVEVVSPSSVNKDTQRLPLAYFAAGVREYWIVDARGDDLVFKIQTRGRTAFRTAPVDAEGFAKSRVFARRFRLTRHTNSRGHWVYDLLVR